MEKKKNLKADVAKKSVLFLQIGLIIVLFVAWRGIEWKTTETIHNDDVSWIDNNFIEEADVLEVIEEPIVEPEPEPKPVVVETIEIVDNNTKIEEHIFDTTDNTDDPIIIPEQIEESDPDDDEPIVVPFSSIENAPIFPGCENAGTAAQKKKCMSDNISKLINRKFNTGLGEELGLTGINRIFVKFTIDKKGNITGVRARGPHPKLEKEAKRVAKALPKMKPGIQNHKPVGVTYTLPIVFKVE